MNVSIETMTGLERRLTIAIASEEFESQITQRLQDARGRVNIPGFRVGKVPLKEVRRRYGNAVRAEVAGELMQSSFVQAVQQEEMNPAGSPKLDVVRMDPGIDFEFTATFDVYPTIELADFSKVNVKRPTAEIADDDIQTMVSKLQEQHTTFEPAERAAVAGDQLKIDFVGTLDGERVDSACGEDFTFKVGEGQMIEDFDQAVLGMSTAEEKTFDATFPADYRAEELQNKTVQFAVTVKEVTEAIVPELNDEFFEKFGVTEGGEESFRAEVKKNMERELESARKNQIKQQVMDGLSKIHEFLLPDDVVRREIQALKDQMLSQFQMPQGQAPQLDLPDELFKDQAEQRVRVGLVVNEIIVKHELKADPELVDAQLQTIAEPYDEPDQVINWYRSNPEQMQNIEMGVLEDQVVDLILSQSAVEDVVASYADVLSGAAIADPDQDVESAETEANIEASKDDEKSDSSE
ncbi:MAG: trigger factor [Pseudomonadota bacterium]|nr:trigger factor [Pseudomonadota bacterium]MEC7554354.1 trigger factor [Pseudomonadota bacterium]MEC8059783.1 trigger factor [Pseudomonadota bacterium]